MREIFQESFDVEQLFTTAEKALLSEPTSVSEEPKNPELTEFEDALIEGLRLTTRVLVDKDDNSTDLYLGQGTSVD